MSLSRIRRTLVPAAMAAALLSGCSSNGVAPGVALSIGDDSVARSEVNQVAEAVCETIQPELDQTGEQVPMSQLKQYALSLLTVRLQAEQVAEDQDLEPSAAYRQDVERVEAEAETLPEDLRESYVNALSTEAYLTSLMAQMGERSLAEEGVSASSEEEVMQRGSQLFAAEVVDNKSAVDPSYGAVMIDGVLERAETGTSVPVSDAATALLGEEVDPQQIAALPESQRCN